MAIKWQLFTQRSSK